METQRRQEERRGQEENPSDNLIFALYNMHFAMGLLLFCSSLFGDNLS
jgi:hypothetical protein